MGKREERPGSGIRYAALGLTCLFCCLALGSLAYMPAVPLDGKYAETSSLGTELASTPAGEARRAASRSSPAREVLPRAAPILTHQVPAFLGAIAKAQEAFRSQRFVDTDGDGKGEFGYLAELAGAAPLRRNHQQLRGRVEPPLLPGGFANSGPDGIVYHDRYCFRVFLPGRGEQAVPESSKGGASRNYPDGEQAEKRWCAYAWPRIYGASGTHAFFTNHTGEILVAHNAKTQYSGAENPPPARSAFAGGTAGLLSDSPARSRLALDGQTWHPLAELPPARQTLRVLGEDGLPVAGAQVMALDPGQAARHPRFRGRFLALRLVWLKDLAFPCAGGVTDHDGGWSPVGWGVEGLALALLGKDGRPVDARGAILKRHAGVLTVQLPDGVATELRVLAAETATIKELARIAREDGTTARGVKATLPGYLLQEHSTSSGDGDSLWCCYAWPVDYGRSGRRTFFANQAGQILASTNHQTRYSGHSHPPSRNAAFLAGTGNGLTVPTATNALGNDGQRWLRVH